MIRLARGPPSEFDDEGIKERRLLEVYPEAKGFLEIVKANNGLREVDILNSPYGELEAYRDQSPDEGPFWTLIRGDSRPGFFHVISIGLNRDKPSICTRRRLGGEGAGRTFSGKEVEDNFKLLGDLYQCWFIEDREIQKPKLKWDGDSFREM